MTASPVQPGRDASMIDHKLRAAWQRQRHITHLRGTLLMLAWLLGLLLAGLAVDWLFVLPGYARPLLLVVILGAVGYVGWRRWWSRLHRYDAVRVALEVERVHPELDNLLVSYVQLRAMPAGSTSPGLIAATLDQAVDAAKPTRFTDIIDLSELKRISIASAAVVLVFALLSSSLPTFFAVYFQRLFNPVATAGYPTRTQILQTSGDLVVLRGEPVALTAQADGLLPTEGTLHIQPTDGGWESISIPGDADGQYAHAFPQVIDSFTYYLQIGDARSSRHQVQVVPPPMPQSVAIRIAYPAYMELEPRTVSELNFEAPQGADVTWTLQFAQPIAEPLLQPVDGEPLPLELSSDGRRATLQVTAEQTLPYTFAWTDREHGFRYEGEVRHVMQVIPDRAPDVRLIEPTQDMPATLNRTLELQYQAIDDFGLKNIWIVYAINAEEERRVAVGPAEGRSTADTLNWRPREDITQLREGDVLTYAIEVSDNRNGDEQPNMGRSNARRLFLMSEADYLRAMLERRQQIIEQIDELHGLETEAADVLRGVQLRETQTEQPPQP